MGSPSASGAATPSPAVTAPPRPPQRWVGVRVDTTLVLQEGGAASRRIVRRPLIDEDSKYAPSYVSDLAVAPSQEAVLVARCCEPVSGSIDRVALDAGWRKPRTADQGHRFDVSGDLYARTDPRGDVAIRQLPKPAAQGRYVPQVAAVDVAVEPGGHRVVALLDERWTVDCCPPSGSPSAPAVLVLARQENGRWRKNHTWPLSEHYCAAVWLRSGKVALLHGQGWGPCTGARLDLFNPDNGKLEKDAVRLPRAAQHVGVDDSGTYLIYTAESTGGVHWLTLDGRTGQLAENGFTMADW